MLKKVSLILTALCLSACSMSSYIPFVSKENAVIDLDKSAIDQKSYAVAYEATIQTYTDRVNKDYDVNSFTSGVNDWFLGRILVPIEQIRGNLYQGMHDSNVYAYYSGVVFAAELQNNFSRLSADCWQKIDRPSITQGIYDAMRGLQKGDVRDNDDEYLVKGSEQLLNICK
ncbi:hypothetical protein [Conservatibacter flavescens]|uniref:Lipoprotein n=1 Tax=Conservatibacter flavescens TaxID=28161 RepID=A0A2M8RZK6_9PAST|nr:hypothetical protein [Conservatibacter flavescens]PJG84304.1 hypothetical protein CVP05_11890 [Conservatibacter flavescens]